jgi:uncharacterized Rmd1/YagE family protein
MKFFKARQEAYGTDPRTIEDVIYTPYAYEPGPSTANRSSAELTTGDLLGIPELRADQAADTDANGNVKKHKRKHSKFDAPAKAEVFIFKYGTVVIWGMTEQQEKRFLSSM